MSDADKAKAQLLAKRDKEVVPTKNLLSTGYTPLNLALSDRTKGGYPKGKYVLLVGDSESAKTWLGVSALAEATINEEFNDYDLIYDAPEEGADMDKAFFFGKKAERRIRPPRGTTNNPEFSETVEDFYDNLDMFFNKGKPFVYVLDSETALGSRQEQKKQAKMRQARRQNEQSSGDYQLSKPKYHSSHLREARLKLGKTGSILIIISQTRRRIGIGAQYDPKTRAGGDALKFYAHLELWTSVKQNFTKKVHNTPRQQGILVQVKVKKNRVTGKKWTVDMPIFWETGIDEVGGCIDFLVSEEYWKASKQYAKLKTGIIQAKDFSPKSVNKDKLVRLIEQNSLEHKLRFLVSRRWREIEAACRVERKNRYL